MSFGAKPRTTDLGWRPPTTMVDVLFLILTFFLTIAAFRDKERELPVSLPMMETDKSNPATRTQVVITVTADGTIYLGQEPHTLDSLTATLKELVRDFPGETVVIRGDKNAKHGDIMKIKDAAFAVGLHRVFEGVVKGADDL